MIYIVCIILGIFLGQELSLPNIKIATIYLLNYIKDKTQNEEQNKSVEIKETSIYEYLYKYFKKNN